jgi:hypothetical protein
MSDVPELTRRHFKLDRRSARYWHVTFDHVDVPAAPLDA